MTGTPEHTTLQQPLAGHQFTVSSDHRGHATVSAPGLPAVTVEPCWEEWPVQINTHSTHPTMYAPSLDEARAWLGPDNPGEAIELPHTVVVRWLLPGDLLCGFADLAQVMHYATVLGPETPGPSTST